MFNEIHNNINTISKIKNENKKGNDGSKYKKSFLNSINDGLNVSKALGVLWDLIKDDKVGSKNKYKLV